DHPERADAQAGRLEQLLVVLGAHRSDLAICGDEPDLLDHRSEAGEPDTGTVRAGTYRSGDRLLIDIAHVRQGEPARGQLLAEPRKRDPRPDPHEPGAVRRRGADPLDRVELTE